jgi:hypothetical protein
MDDTCTGLLPLALLLFVLWLVFGRRKKPAPAALAPAPAPREDAGRTGPYRAIAHNVTDPRPTPEGFATYIPWFEIAGVQRHLKAAREFVRAGDQTVTLVPEPTNPVSPHAIRVVGFWSSGLRDREAPIGYVPDAIAETLARAGLTEAVQARMVRVYQSAGGFLDVRIKLIGPRGDRARFRMMASDSEDDGDDD